MAFDNDSNGHFDTLNKMVDGALDSLELLIQTQQDGAMKLALSALQTTMKVAAAALDKIKADTMHKTTEEIERKRSLVLIGIPEQIDPKPQNRAKMDEQIVEDVLNQLGVETRPTATYRLGRPPSNPANSGFPRLIKIVFPASIFQRIALANWKRHRSDMKQQASYSRLIIRPSLTVEQRNKEKEERAKRFAQKTGSNQTNNTQEN